MLSIHNSCGTLPVIFCGYIWGYHSINGKGPCLNNPAISDFSFSATKNTNNNILKESYITQRQRNYRV